jgi:two-component system KDP operon response regulator KdpE
MDKITSMVSTPVQSQDQGGGSANKVEGRNDPSKVPGLDLDTLHAMEDRKRVLIIDDDPDVVDILKITLRKAGFDVSGALDAQAAVDKCIAFHPNLILLDLMMPVVDGWETFRRLRKITEVPVVIVSAKDNQTDVVRGLDVGADDYITKPFFPPEIVSRVQAVLRRAGPAAPITTHLFPELELAINLDTQEVISSDTRVELSPKEYLVLGILADQAPKPVTYESIAKEVWGEDSPSVRNRLRWIVHRLRQKLGEDPSGSKIIINRRGFGYQLNSDRR